MQLIGIVGLPGSGKSTLFEDPSFDRFLKIDDIGKNWPLNEQSIHDAIQQNRSVLVSDIEFCNSHARTEFEKRIGRQFVWICFENAPWKCAINSLHRVYTGAKRPLGEELVKIIRLSKSYEPFGNKIQSVKMSDDALNHLPEILLDLMN
jgi:hypothetical protein